MAQKLLTLMKYTDRMGERIYGSRVQLFVNKVSNKLNTEIRNLKHARSVNRADLPNSVTQLISWYTVLIVLHRRLSNGMDNLRLRTKEEDML